MVNDKEKIEKHSESKYLHHNIGFFFESFNPIVALGCKRPLTEEDILSLPSDQRFINF